MRVRSKRQLSKLGAYTYTRIISPRKVNKAGPGALSLHSYDANYAPTTRSPLPVPSNPQILISLSGLVNSMVVFSETSQSHGTKNRRNHFRSIRPNYVHNFHQLPRDTTSQKMAKKLDRRKSGRKQTGRKGKKSFQNLINFNTVFISRRQFFFSFVRLFLLPSFYFFVASFFNESKTCTKLKRDRRQKNIESRKTRPISSPFFLLLSNVYILYEEGRFIYLRAVINIDRLMDMRRFLTIPHF